MTTKAEAPAFDLSALEALFERQLAPLKETVAALQKKVDENDAMIPKFVPMQNRKNPSGMPTTPAEKIAAMAGMKPGEIRSDTARSIPVTVNGHPIDADTIAAITRATGAEFLEGEEIRINPTSRRRHSAEGSTWATTLAKAGRNLEGYGVVMEVDNKITPYGRLYRVRADGHTGERGMNFESHELLRA